MEQERFGSFSLEKLFAMNDLSQVGAVYNRECFIISCDPGKEIELFKYPCKINAFILVICSEGEISLTCNLNSCEIKNNRRETDSSILPVHAGNGFNRSTSRRKYVYKRFAG